MRRVIVAAALESRPSRAPWQRPFALAAVARTAGCRRNDGRASSDCRAGARRWNPRTSGGDRWRRWGHRRPSPTAVFDAGRHAHHLDFRPEPPASGVDAVTMTNPDPTFSLHDRLRLDRSGGDGRTEPGAAAAAPAASGANHQATPETPPPTPPAMTSSQKRPSERTGLPQGFSVVLVLGDIQGTATPDDVPPAARKALVDMRDFLPFKSYRLLDAAWVMCCGQQRMGSATRGRLGQNSSGSYADAQSGAARTRGAGVRAEAHDLANRELPRVRQVQPVRRRRAPGSHGRVDGLRCRARRAERSRI